MDALLTITAPLKAMASDTWIFPSVLVLMVLSANRAVLKFVSGIVTSQSTENEVPGSKKEVQFVFE
jgi:hypothetical protein